MSQKVISAHEIGKRIDYSFEELSKYHGPTHPGGVAHALKVMQRAFPLLAPDGYIERLGISINTSFGGPGARDAFEFVTRVVSRKKYNVDKKLGARWAGDNYRENYFFQLIYKNKKVSLVVKPGHVRNDFIELASKANRTIDEEIHLAYLKQEMTGRLLALDSRAVYMLVD